MKNIFLHVESLVLSFSKTVPLEFFIFFGSIIEEIFAPLPSPLVPATAGSLAQIQGKSFFYLTFLSLIGSFGKTIGAWVVYIISKNLGYALLARFGEKLGITPAQVENFGNRLQKRKSIFSALFFLRSLPVVPSVFISSSSGILKVRPIIFTLSTFFGSYIRDFIFLYFGYVGLSVFGRLLKGINNAETFLQIVLLFSFLIFLGILYFRRRKYAR